MNAHQPLILVADDDGLMRAVVSAKLKARGWRVAAVEDGEGALKAVAAERPALIVLDAMMPGMDGVEVLRTLKADPGSSEIPVIMLTARSLESDIVGALQLGASDYLVKPFIPEELAMRVARLLPRKAA
ncbi:MAG TPA: response regulator [Beijerinckiaceae bacterium]